MPPEIVALRSAYQRAVREGREPTPEQRAAQTEYQRLWRQQAENQREWDRIRERARARALRVLADRHPEEYEQLLQVELEALNSATA
jgi:hypothetical protein